MNHFNSLLQRALIVLGCGVLLGMPLRADEIATAGRALAAKCQDSLVTVQIAVKLHITSGEEQNTDEEKGETIGTIIDPSGLIVVSLTTADPSAAIEKMGSEHDQQMKVSCEVVDLKIRTADGKEIPGKIVLRDKDLDLAFIRPLKKLAEPLPALNLANAATPGLLDQIAIVYRLGNVGNRATSITLDRVQAVMQKPRTFFVPGVAAMSTRLGAPVFALDGTPVGMLLLRTSPESSSSMSSASGGIGGSNMLYVVLPAADVLDAAKQAPQADAVKDPAPAKPADEKNSKNAGGK